MKMIKNNFVLLIFCLSFAIGFSQEFKTQSSEIFRKESNEQNFQIAFASPYGFMVYSELEGHRMVNGGVNTIQLSTFDQSMQRVGTQNFELPMLGNRPADLRKIVEQENQLVFLSSAMNTKSGEHNLYAQVYSKTDNAVGQTKILGTFPIEKYSRSGAYQIAVSPDRSKIAVFANMPFDRKSKEKVKIWLFGEQLNLLWEQTATLQFDSERAYREKVFVTNAGQVFLEKVTDFEKKSKMAYLLKFDGSSSEKTTFSTEKFFPMEMALVNVEGKPMLAGFFWDGDEAIIQMNEDEGEENDGAFLYDLSQKKLIGKHLFPAKRQSNVDDGKIDYNSMKSLKVVDVKSIDGNIYLTGEKQLRKSEFRNDGSMEIDYFYTFGPAVIVNLDTQGTLKAFAPFFYSTNYKNSNENGSLAVLDFNKGLRVFSNYKKNGRYDLDTVFAQEKVSYGDPEGYNILPSTVKRVDNYNLIYYLTNTGNGYYLNKMTW